jgi:hypothetical protein
MHPIIPHLAAQHKLICDLTCPPRSDCCFAAVDRVGDELLACSTCGKLCDEWDVNSVASRL